MVEALRRNIAPYPGRIGLDLETTGLDPRRDRVLLVGIAFSGGSTLAFAPTPADWRALAEWLNGPRTPVVIGHNLAFDVQFLWSHGVYPTRLWDTMLAEQLLTAGLDLPADLASVAGRRLGVTLDKAHRASFIGAGDDWTPTSADLAYLRADVSSLEAIALQQVEELRAQRLHGDAFAPSTLELRALPAFAALSLVGMRLHQDRHAAVIGDYQLRGDLASSALTTALAPNWHDLEGQRFAAEDAAYQAAVTSVKQAQAAVTRERAALRHKSPKLDATTDALDDALRALAEARLARPPKPPASKPFNAHSREQVLGALARHGVTLPDLTAQSVHDWLARNPGHGAYAVLEALQAWKTAVKVTGTYGGGLLDYVGPDGRVHGSFRQLVSTGRSSSSHPNMQNMPPDIRACFVPEPGNVFVVADFSGMELRIAAALSGDEAMLDAFASGQDLHALTAARALGKATGDVTKEERQLGKTVNFGILYGVSASGLVTRGLAPDRGTAERFLTAFGAAYPQAVAWRKAQGAQALVSGYVRTASGRKRYFKPVGEAPRHGEYRREWEKARAGLVREAGNAPIQGTGADIAKEALARIWEEVSYAWALDPDQHLLGLPYCPVNFVHDEIVVECHAEEAEEVLATVLRHMRDAGRDILEAEGLIDAEGVIAERWEK